jgi:uncharacterized protein YhbP (UPF0306 family)
MLPKNFSDFIKSQHVVHLATCKDNSPWAAACFYAYDGNLGALVIASSEQTRHIQEALQFKKVAGSIALQTTKVGQIEGVQFEGELLLATPAQKKIYYKKYPYALAMKPKLWTIQINCAKLTQNRLGFGRKEHFLRPTQP